MGHAPGRCAGRDHHPCLGQMWKLQLSTCLVMLSFPRLVCMPWAEVGSESKAGLCLKSQERKESKKGIYWHRLHTLYQGTVRITEQSASAVKLTSICWSRLLQDQSSSDSPGAQVSSIPGLVGSRGRVSSLYCHYTVSEENSA